MMVHLEASLDRLRDEVVLARRRGRTGEELLLSSIIEEIDQARLEDWRVLFEQVLPLKEAAARAGFHPSAFSQNRRTFPVEPLPDGQGEGVRVRDCPCRAGRILVLLGLEAIPDLTGADTIQPDEEDALPAAGFTVHELDEYRRRGSQRHWRAK
jgi:hypothetical protein